MAQGRAPGREYVFTPTLDTSAYADGDVLFVATELTDFMGATGGRGLVQSVTVTDASDQGAAFDIWFFNGSVSLGTINAAVALSDTDALKHRGRIEVQSGNYYDVGGAKVADLTSFAGSQRYFSAAGGTRSIWVGGVARGAATYSSTALQIVFNLLWA